MGNQSIHAAKTPLELLRTYEPVLRFARSERFYPMRVEDYLRDCRLFSNTGPIRARVRGTAKKEMNTHLLGEKHDCSHYLRYIDPFLDFNTWLTLIVLATLAALLTWVLVDARTAGLVALISFGGIGVLYAFSSKVRLRLVVATLVVAGLARAAVIPARFLVSGIGLDGGQLAAAWGIYLLLAVIVFLAALYLLFKYVVPELPGLIFDSVSSATEQTAEGSYEKYRQHLLGGARPTYYGRVLELEEDTGAVWQILQYHYFYAFNDWRLAANGINHHEGDWEMAAVYLKDGQPYAVLYSQHHDGAYAPWAQALRVREADGSRSNHPLIYAALGSHANYGAAAVIQSPELYHPGPVQRALYAVDGLILALFGLFNPRERRRERERAKLRARLRPGRASQRNVTSQDEFVPGLPMEYASGDGIRIGYGGLASAEKVIDSEEFLLDRKSQRQVTLPDQLEWDCVLLDPEPDWVGYQGLWGVRSMIHPLIPDESGPPGPKWNRVQKGQGSPQQRTRWQDPLGWLRTLESNSS